MRRLLLAASLAVLAGCAGLPLITTPTFDAESELAAPYRLHVITVDTPAKITHTPRMADTAAAWAGGGAIGGLIAESMNDQRRDKKALVEAELATVTEPLLTEDYLWRSLAVGDATPTWQLRAVERGVEPEALNASISAALENAEIDAVVVLERFLYMTPKLSQLQVGLSQEVYLRDAPVDASGNLQAQKRRTFFVYPEYRPLIVRAISEEEREAEREKLRAEANAALEEPDVNRMRVALRLERQLEELEEAETVSLDVAVREHWTSEVVAETLQTSEAVIRHMVGVDWSETATKEVPAETLVRFAVSNKGDVDRTRGIRLDDYNGYAIVLTKDGSLVAIQPDQLY